MIDHKEEGLTQHFSSFEEMVEFCEIYREHPDLYDSIRFLCGLYPNEGKAAPIEIDGKQVLIDASISRHVANLRDAGYETLACCSGVKREHEGAKFNEDADHGYICLLRNEETQERIKHLPVRSGVTIDQNADCYFKPAITIKLKAENDDKLEQLWEMTVQELIDAASAKAAG